MQLGACSYAYALTAVSISRQLTSHAPTAWLVAHDQLLTSPFGRGAVRSAIIVPSSLSSGTSDVTKVLAQTIFISSSDCSKLRCRESLSSLRSDSLTGTSALVIPVLNSVRIELWHMELLSLPYSDILRRFMP
ncbi:hypothetical protein Acr_06g0005010 [Actinidia rufa]|uniref:Uncharacterized protein n=1 Tax=Actinidia rufa TaxID=165716 RepID=A0A7J0EQ04_9ERIC|nr:hypothetical protein Acr_06g0005010 [Actinidia rufa]